MSSPNSVLISAEAAFSGRNSNAAAHNRPESFRSLICPTPPANTAPSLSPLPFRLSPSVWSDGQAPVLLPLLRHAADIDLLVRQERDFNESPVVAGADQFLQF